MLKNPKQNSHLFSLDPMDINELCQKPTSGTAPAATLYTRFCSRFSRLHDRPVFLFLLVLAAIFFAESLVMLFLRQLPPLPMLPEAVLDAFLLSLLAVPILQILFLKPLTYNIRIREKADIERKKAQEFDRMKSEFISTAAHELYTPLASVKGYVELLTSPEYSFSAAEREEFLAIIQDKSDILERIVDDLLQLSRSESGHSLQINAEPCDLRPLVDESVAVCRQFFPRHRIEVDLAGEMPPLPLDRIRIGQVLVNLLSNAAKYSPEGSAIRLSAEQHGRWIRLQVQDQGIGMTDEQSLRAFDKFYRADRSDTAKGGLGLGLAIARMIVEAHTGTIWLASSPGLGTTVSFTLPLPAEENP